MRVMSLLSVLLASGAVGLAQTNALDYTMPGYGAAGTNATAAAPTTAPPRAVRELSLQDCIQLALQHNLDLQIERTRPQVARYTVRGDYGIYDPVLTLAGQHDHDETGATLFQNTPIPGAKTDDNSFSGDLSGFLPWGMNYGLSTVGPIIDKYGNRFSAGTITNGIGTNAIASTNAVANRFENSSGSVEVHVSQHLLKDFWIDSGRLAIRVDKNRLRYSELGLKWQVIQTITKLELAYFDLIFDRENVVVQQKAVELAERLVAQNKKKLEVGALAPLDLESAESQAAQNRAAVIKAQSQLATQERVVKQLITDQFAAWADLELKPSGKLSDAHQAFDRQTCWSKGLSRRPDLLQARLDVEKQGIQLKFDRNQLLPQLDILGTYGYNGSGKEFSDALYDIQQQNQPFYSFGGQLVVPLANVRARNSLKSDKVTLQQLLLTLKQSEQTIMISIDNDIGTIQANYEQVLATRAARQYAESALNAEEMKLQNGKSTVYTVLQMQRDLTTARGAEIQALDTYNQSLSTLSQDDGSTLERLGIEWQAK